MEHQLSAELSEANAVKEQYIGLFLVICSNYIDLLKSPDTDAEDGDLGVRYGLRFLDRPPEAAANHHWFRAGRILDIVEIAPTPRSTGRPPAGGC